MSLPLAPLDPVDQAQLVLLANLSGGWSGIHLHQLTHAQTKALTLLVYAGAVEQRADVLATMSGLPQRLKMRCRWSGHGPEDDLIAQRIVWQMPEWVGHDGGLTGHLEMHKTHHAVRLTDQGELAQRDLPLHGPTFVLGTLRGCHAPPEIVVESCQVEAWDAPGHATLGPSGPVAVAQARADVNVINQVTVAPVINVQVPAQLSQAREASPGRSEPTDPTVYAHAEPDRTANPTPTKDPSGSESDNEGDVDSLAALLGSEDVQAMRIVQDPELTVDAKMRLLLDLDRRFAGFESTRWAAALRVTPQAVRKTDCWVQILRKGQNK